MNIQKTFSSALLCCLPFAGTARAQTPDSGAFFIRLGKDTIAVERYVRTPLQLVGEAVLRTPQTRTYKLTVTRKDDGTMAWYEVLNNPVAGVPNSVPVMRNLVTYGTDSARIETWVAATPRPGRSIAAKPDMIPLQLPFYSTYETALMQARKASNDTVTINMLSTSGPIPYLIKWIGHDSVTLWNPQGGTIRARVDKEGRLLGWSGESTTFKVVVTRAKWADIDAYAKRYAATDAEGKAIGALSPRDSILDRTYGDSGVVTVKYSRPSKRGRVIFGGIVPWGQVWRTGANAATTIEFHRQAAVVNGVTIPPGRYTLWSIPDPKQWQLILNKQTGQWGTVYDEKQDLVRIPVKTVTMSVPVESFTIDIQEKAPNAVMTLTWDKTRVVVPIEPAGSK